MASMRLIIGAMLIVSLIVSTSGAQQPGLSIVDMRVEPATVKSGGKVRLSCRIICPAGSGAVERVAATVSEKDRVTGYPRLYDDGTHGDKAAQDGLYSIVIRVSEVTGERKIRFQAVSIDKQEIESELILLKVK
jgi:hypothetical protein